MLDICELDTQLRELKLKAQYNEKVFEPLLFRQCPEIKSQIIEILYEKNSKAGGSNTLGENISLSFGNAIEHELRHANDPAQSTLGRIRSHLWRLILCSPDTYNALLSLEFLGKVEEGKTYKQLIDFQLLVYVLQQGQIHFFVDDDLLTDKLKVSFKAVKAVLSSRTQGIQGQTHSLNDYENLIEKSFSVQEVKGRDRHDDKKHDDKKQNTKRDALRSKFLEKQKKFQNKFLGGEPMQLEPLQYSEVCLLCSSPLEDDICYPALIQLNNLNDYLHFYPAQPDCYFLLTTCQHKFHEQCIKQSFSQEK